MVNTKICKKCNVRKDINEFYKTGKYFLSYCKQCSIKISFKWHKENPDKSRKSSSAWKKKYPEKRKEQSRRYLKTNKGRLVSLFKRNIYHSISKGSKNKIHWEYLVGYVVKDLKLHLEKKFTKEMSWGNYGTYWHIDHIIPISAFNFETPFDIDFKKCWALDNLQPLEARDNLSKNSKLTSPFQPSLAFSVVDPVALDIIIQPGASW